VDEGAAFGAALLGGVAGGVWEDIGEAIAAAVVPTETFEPDAGWTRAYAESLERYRALYPALKGAHA
jgi:xylulokinase